MFPNFPGIPPLQNKQVISGAALLAAPVLSSVLSAKSQQWGIFKSDKTTLAIDPDSFIGIEYLNSQNVSSYPIERGSFASYNKVQNPFNAIVTISKSGGGGLGQLTGGKSARSDFLDTLEALIQSTDLYVIVTPEKTYENVSIERFDYSRKSSGGAGIIVANLHLIEIRQADVTTTPGTASATQTTAPSAQQPVNSGQVTAQ